MKQQQNWLGQVSKVEVILVLSGDLQILLFFLGTFDEQVEFVLGRDRISVLLSASGEDSMCEEGQAVDDGSRWCQYSLEVARRPASRPCD